MPSRNQGDLLARSPVRSAGGLLLGLCFVLGCGGDPESSGTSAATTATSGTGAGGSGGAGTSSAAGGGGAGGSTTSSGTGGAGGGVVQGDPLFIAVGYGGRRISSIDGLTWANDVIVDPNGGDDNTLFRGVGYGDGLFIAVGGSSEGQIATSTDGITWEFHTPGSSWLGDVAYLGGAGGVFVTAGGNGLRLRSADGGVTWTDEPGYYAGHFRGIAAGGGRAVAAGHTYGNSNEGLTSTTTDGITWTEELTGGAPFNSIAFGAGVFVAAGNQRCAVSSDGTEWQPCALTAADLDRVTFVAGEFVIRDGSGFHRSSDGATWEHVDGDGPTANAFGANTYVGASWPDKLWSSPDLITWTLQQENIGPAFTDIEFGLVNIQ